MNSSRSLFSSCGYNEVLKDISLTIPEGRTVAFVGPSGGGKTTLANLISRFFDPQSGMVTIGGVNVKDIPREELMNTVSFVFQNSRLIKASILENVRMGKPEATREEILAALHHAQCDDILEIKFFFHKKNCVSKVNTLFLADTV